MEQLLSIGEFAERSGLSRSALRFYDQNELLRPALVDADSGYRYYAAQQLRQASLIRRLRAAEMPVGTLRAYLDASLESRSAILEEHIRGFRERASAVETAVNQLREGARTEAADQPHGCSLDPGAFAIALSQVSFAIADPAVRRELGAIWVETKDGSLRLVTTDSYRLAIRDLVPKEFGSGGIRGVIEAEHVPRVVAALPVASSLLLSQTEFGVVTIAIDNRLLAVGGRGKEFPDYEEILSGTPAGHRIALARDGVERALARLPLDAEHLLLDFGAGGLGIEAGGRRQEVVGKWSAAPLQMYVDPQFFAEALDATVGPDLMIEASDPLHPITLRSADTGTFSVMTMPIRPPGDE